MTEQQLTRRERYRQQTFDEIKNIAVQQLAEGGAAAVSLNAIARTMAMSAPAIYRYFASRDELLSALAIDFYGDLADTLDTATRAATSPTDRIRSLANAYRGWALAHSNAYRLIFETPTGSGLDAGGSSPAGSGPAGSGPAGSGPAESDVEGFDPVRPAAQRSMDSLLAALAAAGIPATEPVPPELEDQIRTWAHHSRHRDLPTPVLRLGLIWWSQLHGLVSLELGQHLRATGVNPELLYHAEIDTLLARFAGTGAGDADVGGRGRG